jgi:hypothetical protein
MLMKQTPGPNVLFFLSVLYEFSEQARVFVLGKLFQPYLMFVGKAVAYQSRVPFTLSTVG